MRSSASVRRSSWLQANLAKRDLGEFVPSVHRPPQHRGPAPDATPSRTLASAGDTATRNAPPNSHNWPPRDAEPPPKRYSNTLFHTRISHEIKVAVTNTNIWFLCVRVYCVCVCVMCVACVFAVLGTAPWFAMAKEHFSAKMIIRTLKEQHVFAISR